MKKTITRYTSNLDEGLSITVCEDQDSPFKGKILVEHIGGYETIDETIKYYKIVLSELNNLKEKYGTE